ncbi:MAG: pseudouridine synthase [Arenicella sp.]|nr:pseudouridine synthase [Arenicella sp.]
MDNIYNYYAIFKPYGVLSQFSRPEPHHKTLADLGFKFPKDVYPVGRLDNDSEGLLILTNDKNLNHQLLNPSFAHSRTYAVQVDGQITNEVIKMLEDGIAIKVGKKSYQTMPANAKLLPKGPSLAERDPPVRFRKLIPTSWLELTLIEGKNRQVRKMCAKTGFPVLRLVRTRIEKLLLNGMQSGDVKKLDGKDLKKLLGI